MVALTCMVRESVSSPDHDELSEGSGDDFFQATRFFDTPSDTGRSSSDVFSCDRDAIDAIETVGHRSRVLQSRECMGSQHLKVGATTVQWQKKRQSYH